MGRVSWVEVLRSHCSFPGLGFVLCALGCWVGGGVEGKDGVMNGCGSDVDSNGVGLRATIY